MDQQIRFCTSADGTRIAYADLGSGPPLVAVFTWACSLELDWHHSESRAWLERMAARQRFVRFDRRGVGASDREAEDFSMVAQVADLAAVVDHLSLQQFALWGFGDGAAVSVVYATLHPERLSRLILWDSYAYGAGFAAPDMIQKLTAFVVGNWSMARRSIADTILPTGPVEAQRWLSHVMSESMTAEIAAGYIQSQYAADIRSELPRVTTPTLVLHRRGDRIVPIRAGREVAALIPNAAFIGLEGDMGYTFYGEREHVAIVEEFVRSAELAPHAFPGQPGTFRTILFTDVVENTALLRRIGDEAWRAVMREHEEIVRAALKEHGGTEISTSGDGFFASFGSSVRALQCAVEMQRALAQRNETAEHLVEVRIGLNAGEPIEEGKDVLGTAVTMAARIMSQAGAGEILVSDVLRQLVAGKGFLFADRGEFVAKGFEEPVRVYEVRWRE
jgi:class 3 adenylate cyclase/pimeloyl-ACP methyl ester carboxylesterase